jgi:hypothetical protein
MNLGNPNRRKPARPSPAEVLRAFDRYYGVNGMVARGLGISKGVLALLLRDTPELQHLRGLGQNPRGVDGGKWAGGRERA